MNVVLNPSYCKKDINTKVYKAYLLYLEKNYPLIDIRDLCLEAGLPIEYLTNLNNWVSVTFDDRFTHLCIKKTGDPKLCYKVGSQGLSEPVIGMLLSKIIQFSSIQFIYSQLPKLTNLFNKITYIDVLYQAKDYVHIHLSVISKNLAEEDTQALKHNFHNILENTLGYYASVPTYQGLSEAKVYYMQRTELNQFPVYDIRIYFQPALHT